MSKAKFLDNHSIAVQIPLTAPSGKIRVKTRSSIFEYGIPIATKKNKFSQMNYVEWQIGYDTTLDDKEKMAETSLGHLRFSAYNGKTKALYELSEYMFKLHQFGYITKKEINTLIQEIEKIPESKLIENHPSCQIKRTHPKENIINGIEFWKSKIEYPLLIHRFGVYEIIAEIVVREKQKAIGTQAMLYFCFPIT